MRDGERHPDGDRTVAPGEGDAAPAPAPEPIPPTGRRVGIAETLAAPAAPAPRPEPIPPTGRRVGIAETLAAPAPAPAPEPIPPTGRRVGIAETLPADGSRAKSPTGNTRPGPGVGAKPGPAMLETLPAPGAAADAPLAATVGAATAVAGAAATLGETITASVAAAPAHPIIRPPKPEQNTAEGDESPHAATLQGPYTVADLPSLPRVNDDTYAIGTEIARGGMGKILAARDRRLRREVVIKVMRREYGRIDPRFEREALITARLQHPSIVRIYDAGVLGDGRAFYAMERVRGRSLEVVLEQATTLRERLALLPHAIAVCDALAYAHNEGIVHRDLKPSNVLLGPFGETVVIDWGLAKDLRATDDEEPNAEIMRATATVSPTGASDSSGANRSGGSGGSSEQLTQLGAVMGTPAYMAPEQARGEVADERTDVYALGALLYTLLTGGPPVTGTTADELIAAVVAGKRTHIALAEPALPPELATIVERAMGHERAGRYQNAKALADDLRSFTAGKLVPSHEYTTWQLVRRWIGKHRLPVGIALTAIVVLVAIGVFAFRNVVEERNIARAERNTARVLTEIAEDKSDTLVMDQVDRYRAKDPSLAAAWMKQLSDRALGWAKTATLADELRRDGLAFQLLGHRNGVELIAAPRDGVHVASASDDGSVRRWDIVTRESVELTGHAGPIDTMIVSGNGTYLATAGSDHKVILWTLASGGRRDLVGHGNTVRGVAFSADDSKLASTSEDGTLYVWDVASATGHELLHYTHSLRPVGWLDDKTLLIGAFDGRIGRVDIATKKVTWFVEHKAEIRSLAITPDRLLFVACDEDGRVTLWDARTNKLLRELQRHEDVARRALITRDGKFVITGGGSKDVHVHTLPDGVFHPLVGNTAGVKDIALSDDGLVASAGIDTTVHLWKLDGTLLHTWRGHTASVKGVAFVGRHVVSGSEDNKVRVWRLDDPPPAPRGTAMRQWLDDQTNLSVAADKTPQN